MYTPKQFEESDQEALRGLIRAAPLATFITNGPEGLVANHIPFVLSGEDFASSELQAHTPRANPLRDLLSSGQNCLAIFHGPEGYISPSYYATKEKHGKVVPTWNYAVVHVHGRGAIVDDSAWVRRQMERLTSLCEGSRQTPWAISDAPTEFVERLAESVVGIRLTMERIEGKTKASQNQPVENQQSILQSLDRERPEAALTEFMHSVLERNQ